MCEYFGGCFSSVSIKGAEVSTGTWRRDWWGGGAS